MVKIKLNDLPPELTPEESAELSAAEKRLPVFDDDSPEMTEEMLSEFKRIRNLRRTKKTASIRLSPKAQAFSESYGKGYTSFLSRLIDAALDDEALIRKCY